MHKTEVVSLKTLLEETEKKFKAVASNEVDVREISENINEKLFPPFVEIYLTDLLMRTRHLTSIRSNLESDHELVFKRFQEIQNSQQTAVGRKFTGVLSLLLFPQLIAGFYGQNFENTPGYKEFFWGLFAGPDRFVSVLQFYGFRKKDYL